MEITLLTDSSAAKSFASQRGLGRMRHLAAKGLWIQEEICRSRLKLEKIAGTENPADVLTKFLGRKEVSEACLGMNVEIVHEGDE